MNNLDFVFLDASGVPFRVCKQGDDYWLYHRTQRWSWSPLRQVDDMSDMPHMIDAALDWKFHELYESPLSPPFKRENWPETKRETLNDYAAEAHAANQIWWHDIETGERLDRNKGEQLALIHSEISECLEGVRKGLMDDHLPHRPMEEVELADALIRIFDYAAGHGLDLQGAYEEKMAYNAQRADHKREQRAASGGKKF